MAREKIAGIYSITSIASGKVYIGQSADIEIRLKNHQSSLRYGRHNNTHLQRHYDKYGPDDLVYKVVKEVEEECLLDHEEQCTVDGLRFAGVYLFNMREDCTSSRGVTRTDEQKDKMSTRRRGEEVLFVLVDPEGFEHEFSNIARFSREHSLSHSAVHHVLDGTRRQTKGWFTPTSSLAPRPKTCKLTDKVRDDVCALYEEGMTLLEVGNKLGISWSSVSYTLRKRGIPTRPRWPSSIATRKEII